MIDCLDDHLYDSDENKLWDFDKWVLEMFIRIKLI